MILLLIMLLLTVQVHLETQKLSLQKYQKQPNIKKSKNDNSINPRSKPQQISKKEKQKVTQIGSFDYPDNISDISDLKNLNHLKLKSNQQNGIKQLQYQKIQGIILSDTAKIDQVSLSQSDQKQGNKNRYSFLRDVMSPIVSKGVIVNNNLFVTPQLYPTPLIAYPPYPPPPPYPYPLPYPYIFPYPPIYPIPYIVPYPYLQQPIPNNDQVSQNIKPPSKNVDPDVLIKNIVNGKIVSSSEFEKTIKQNLLNMINTRKDVNIKKPQSTVRNNSIQPSQNQNRPTPTPSNPTTPTTPPKPVTSSNPNPIFNSIPDTNITPSPNPSNNNKTSIPTQVPNPINTLPKNQDTNKTSSNASMQSIQNSKQEQKAGNIKFIQILRKSKEKSQNQPPLIKLQYIDYIQKIKPQFRNIFNTEIAVYRKVNFQVTLNLINIFNRDPSRTFNMGINKFTDITLNQFNNSFPNTLLPNTIIVDSKLKTKPTQSKIIDWNCVASPVIQPQICSASYIFAAVEVIQMTIRAYLLQNVDLSIQQVLSCGNFTVCRKGSGEEVFRYAKNSGIGPSNLYPYFKDRQIPNCQEQIRNSTQYIGKKKFIKSYQIITQNNCQQLVDRLKTRPLAAAITSKFLQYYSDGVYDIAQNEITLDHTITLLGYIPEIGYLIKNSWGKGWGIQGYGFVAESSGICNYALYVTLQNEREPKRCQNIN